MSKIPKLFELMNKKGVTAKKLSVDTGISTGNISDWKSGRSKPSVEKLKVLAEYFHVSTDYLLGNTSALDKQLEGIDFAFNSELEGLSDEQKQSVINYIRFLKSGNKE